MVDQNLGRKHLVDSFYFYLKSDNCSTCENKGKKSCWILAQNEILCTVIWSKCMLMFGGPTSAYSWGTFINLLSLEKFNCIKVALITKIQLQKHTNYSHLSPAIIFVIQKQSKHIEAVQRSHQWKKIIVSGLGDAKILSIPTLFYQIFWQLRKQG